MSEIIAFHIILRVKLLFGIRANINYKLEKS